MKIRTFRKKLYFLFLSLFLLTVAFETVYSFSGLEKHRRPKRNAPNAEISFLSGAAANMRGEKAIERLRQNEIYDSLMKAVGGARQMDGRMSDLIALDTVNQTAKLVNDGGAYDNFGYSVAISGDTAVVGVPYDSRAAVEQGSAYVFVRSGASWTQQARLTANDGSANDAFGWTVAISDNTIAVGAPGNSVAFNTQGSAYIFTRGGTSWTQQQQLTANDAAAGDLFGSSVAVSGDTVVVGASGDDVNAAGDDRGSAYVFVRGGTNWTQQTRLVSAVSVDAFFGVSVAVSGDTVVVGAYNDTVGTNLSQGSAYIFIRNGVNWTQQARITGNGGAAADNFGNSVAIDGGTVVVGAFAADVGSNVDQGSAYVFVRSGATWTQQAQLNSANGAADDTFGDGVAISGNNIIVGASGDDIGSNTDQGSAYIFTRSGTSWTQQQQLTANDGTSDDLFGYSVAVSGSNFIAGAYGDDIGLKPDQGSAYIFASLSTAPRKPFFDYDGDGRADISLFRPSNRVWYILNSGGGVNYTQFGLSTDKIVPADFDGDGKTDVAVYRPENGTWYIMKSSGGVQYVQFGLAEDFPVPADYNGDGKAEIAVYRPSSGLWFILNPETNQYSLVQFGASEDKPVPADYNGDGKSEIAVYRPSSGIWFIYNSDSKQYTSTKFGISSDKPVPADYNGDGKTDIAVYRPNEGNWYIATQSGGYTVTQFGLPTDLPTPADYDGDGKTDIAVYRPNEGNWYQLKSKDGFGIIRFGLSEDKPTPNAFVY